MKLVIDENLPPRLVPWLNAKGCTAIHIGELGLLGADDGKVWRAAQERDAMVVSRDTDFIERARGATIGGTIRLTVGNCTTRQLVEWLEMRWEDVVRRVEAGDRVIEI